MNMADYFTKMKNIRDEIASAGKIIDERWDGWLYS
jgi:hypothetical protein